MEFPVFIVGSPRSGTSVLVDAFFGIGYGGFREGALLSMLFELQKVIDRQFSVFDQKNPAVLISNVNKDSLKRKMFESLKEIVEESSGSGPWIDKTGNPEMIEGAILLRELWPSALFVFAKRRAIENIISRCVKFPHLSFEYHCADWARNMNAWRNVRGRLPSNSFIEIDQQEIAQDPEASAIRLSSFVGADGEAAAKMLSVFRSGRPQETQPGSSARRISLDGTGWSTSDRELFIKLCGEEMKAFGYSLDAEYWNDSDI